jgi:hypothetical protein
LRQDDGQITTDKTVMQTMTCNFFKELYKVKPEMNPNDILQLFESRITDETNASICQEFTDEEIGNALFQIGLLKASGPDDFYTLLSKELGYPQTGCGKSRETVF